MNPHGSRGVRGRRLGAAVGLVVAGLLAVAATGRLVDQDTPFRMADVTRTIRTFERDGDLPNGVWTFRHNHGLFTLSCDGARIAVGYSDKEPGQYIGNPRKQHPINAEFYGYFG